MKLEKFSITAVIRTIIRLFIVSVCSFYLYVLFVDECGFGIAFFTIMISMVLASVSLIIIFINYLYYKKTGGYFLNKIELWVIIICSALFCISFFLIFSRPFIVFHALRVIISLLYPLFLLWKINQFFKIKEQAIKKEE